MSWEIESRAYAMKRLGKFLKNEQGVSIVAFAVSLIPVLGTVGAAIDYARAYRMQSTLQQAVDTAALGAALKLGTAQVNETGEKQFWANMPIASDQTNIKVFVKQLGPLQVEVSAVGFSKNILMGMFRGIEEVRAKAVAIVGKEKRLLSFTIDHCMGLSDDEDKIYVYYVNKDTREPEEERFLFSNKNIPRNNKLEVEVDKDREFGIMLESVRGGIRSYQRSWAGQPKGYTAQYLSHERPSNLKVSGASQCTNGTVTHAWNDGGGATKKTVYEDMVYQLKCTQEIISESNVRLLH